MIEISGYIEENDSLYYESVLSGDIIELVDLIRHSAWVIKHKDRRPFGILDTIVMLNKRKKDYTFFVNEWANTREIECETLKDSNGNKLKGLAISELHIAAIIYGLRQNFFIKMDPKDPNKTRSIVGWYVDPKKLFLEWLPDMFEDFESAYSVKGSIYGLQGRDFDFLGYLSISIVKHITKGYDPNAGFFKAISVPQPKGQ